MSLKPLILLLIAFTVWVPTTAQGSEIKVQAGEVRVSTDSNGRVVVDTGKNRINVDGNRNRAKSWWQPDYRRSSRYRHCTSRVYQSSSQTTRINGKVHSSRTSTSTCR
ncbi:MAG: hypothetical protein ABEI32_05935 [Halothece sp.]